MAIIAAVANQNNNNNNNNNNANNNNNNNDNDNVFTISVMNNGRSLENQSEQHAILSDCGRKSICLMRKRRSELDVWRLDHLAYIVSRQV